MTTRNGRTVLLSVLFVLLAVALALSVSGASLAQAQESRGDLDGDSTIENTRATDTNTPDRIDRESTRPRMQELEKERMQERRDEVLESRALLRDRLNRGTSTREFDFDDESDAISRRERLEKEIAERREEARTRVEERKKELEERRINIEERAYERRAGLEERAQKRINAYIERTGKRFEAAIERLDKISERILSRIEKFEERGVDMSEPRKLLEDAQSELDAANEAVILFTNDALALFDEKNLGDTFSHINELAKVAKDSIKNAHAALVSAIRVIKNTTKPEDSGDDSAATTSPTGEDIND